MQFRRVRVQFLFEHNDPKIDEVVRGKTHPTDYGFATAMNISWDPAFYETCLKPLVERLDAAAKDAEGEPDDATVDRLFRDAVPQWYDFRYFASELRTKYLAEHFVR